MTNAYYSSKDSTSMLAIRSSPSNYAAIKQKIDAEWTANQSSWNRYQLEGLRDTNLEAGIPYNTQMYAVPFSNQQTPYYFNRTRPLLNMISGWQRKQRKATIVVPLGDNADQATADQWTKILMCTYKREGVHELISDAFHQGALITGLSLIHTYLDFTHDSINGDIKYDVLAFNQFEMDTYWRKHDLSDCRFIRRRSYLTHSAAASLMPMHFDEIMNLASMYVGGAVDGKFSYSPEARGQAGQNLLAYDEFYYKDFRSQTIIVDKQTAEYFDVTDQDMERVKQFIGDNPSVYVEKRDIPTVRLAIQIQGKIFYDGPQPTGIDVYPFCPMIGYYSPSLSPFSDRIQGVARSLRDAQQLLNRRIILSADLIESQVNSGWIFKEGAPLDVNHLFQTGQGRVIPVRKGFEIADIQPIQPPQIPPSFFQMQETFSKELNMVSGVSEENMGQIVDDQASGLKAAMRQSAGMTSLEPIFDRLNFTQNLLGNISMQIIQRNYSPYKISQMLEGEEPAPLFFKKSFGQYHCMVEQGFFTESQKQQEFAQLLALREAGIQVTDQDMLECATIQRKDKIIENMMKQAEAQQQQAQQQMQSEMQEQEARTALAHARAGADEGLEFERKSRVEENRALAIQKLSEANKDNEMALLNKVKILKEIEDIDFGHLERLMNLVNAMKAQESAEAQSKLTGAA